MRAVFLGAAVALALVSCSDPTAVGKTIEQQLRENEVNCPKDGGARQGGPVSCSTWGKHFFS